MVSPVGKAGELLQSESGDPLSSKVVGVIDIAVPATPVVPVEPMKLKVGVAITRKLTSAPGELPSELVAVMV